MAAKKDKMIPSEKERKRALKYATPAGTGRMWVTMGIAFIIFGIILLLIPIGLAISEASAQRYDPESKEYQRKILTPSLRYDILKRDNFKCVICGRTPKKDGVTLHVDHIIPVSKGGKTVPENLRTLCSICNLGKSDKYDEDGLN